MGVLVADDGVKLTGMNRRPRQVSPWSDILVTMPETTRNHRNQLEPHTIERRSSLQYFIVKAYALNLTQLYFYMTSK